MTQIIFGYGSLLSRESRLRTVPSAKYATPALVKGLTRGWWARTTRAGFSTTFLGCLNSDAACLKSIKVDSQTNGVLFEIPDEELSSLDMRESGYKRVQISPSNIFPYGNLALPEHSIWVYVNEFQDEEALISATPNKELPIVQSYVDICLNGCLEQELEYPGIDKHEFCIDFIRSTVGWNKFWVNDRIFPRRPQANCPNANLIDQLLLDNLEDQSLFNQIYLE